MSWRRFRMRSSDPTLLAGFRPFQADLTALPVEVDLSPSRAAGYASLAGAGLFAAGLALFVIRNQPLEGTALYAALAALLPVVLLLLQAWSVLATRRIALFGPLDVRVTEADGEEWRARYQDMAGVRRLEIAQVARNGTTLHQIIELVDRDGTKTLPLYVRRGAWSGQAELELYAARLGVPILSDVRRMRGAAGYRKDQTAERR
ncbi:MAG TPA: hypothetical protein PKA57_01485 [Parvibaculum sp.]|uniref:hypothetical protein n=1 Tax=Parvibaculum sp. TaxID=2024848 RepID=UPI002C71A41B|nr:hypothetical protein [Parvibaculum sp.]HMM13271.1 hypothetical protein [Parvibaculum sp.]